MTITISSWGDMFIALTGEREVCYNKLEKIRECVNQVQEITRDSEDIPIHVNAIYKKYCELMQIDIKVLSIKEYHILLAKFNEYEIEYDLCI